MAKCNDGMELVAGGITLKGKNSYSKIIEGRMLSSRVERIVGRDVKVVFSIIHRADELYLYVGNNESPTNIIIKTFNIEMNVDGRRAEAIVGVTIEKAKSVAYKLEKLFKAGQGFDLEDFHIALEIEELIDYKGIEKAALSQLNNIAV